MKKVNVLLPASLASLILLSGCQSVSEQQTDEFVFTEVGSDRMPFEQRNRRKWDNPVVADLDKDGLVDIITTDHGSSLNIHWNLGGKFSQPQTLLKKDTHGVSVADFDIDGKTEIIVVQGGGNGNNPKYPILFEVERNRQVKRSDPYKYFEFTRGRASKFIDADNDGTLEFIQTGFPLNLQKKGANFLYQLDQNNQYQYHSHLPQAKWLGYKSTLLDFNADGDMDILFFGGKDMVLLQAQPGLEFENVSETGLAENADIDNVTSAVPIDFDNDGDLDLFLTRANHQFKAHEFYDQKSKRFAFFTFRKPKLYSDLTVEGDLVVTNLQQSFPDFGLYLGATKTAKTFNVDRHGHKDFTVTKEQAAGWPDDTSEHGIYIGYVGNNKWRLYDNTRARSAGVIENVIEPVPVDKLTDMPVKLLENKDGNFVDVTAQKGLDFQQQTKSSVAADFNNDGWVDLFVVKYGNMATTTQQLLYENLQGKGFRLVTKNNIISSEVGATGSGAEAIDFDSDGDVDIVYANERGRWHLFENKTKQDKNQQSLTVNVGNSTKKNGAYLGAKVTVSACGRIQTKIIGLSSAPFSQNSDQNIHFGLGSCQQDIEVNVLWSDKSNETKLVPTGQKLARFGR